MNEVFVIVICYSAAPALFLHYQTDWQPLPTYKDLDP